VLGVRHEADHAAVLAGHPGDVAQAAVGVAVDVAEGHPALALQPVEVRGRGDVAALAVLHRDDDPLARGVVGRPGGVGALDAQHLVAVAEVQVAVAGERAGQQPRLAQHLEAVADAQHGQAVPRRGDDVAHQRRARGDRAGPQVVAVREAAGEDDGVDVLQVVVGVPERDRLPAGQAHGPRGVDVVEGAGEGDDPDAHSCCPFVSRSGGAARRPR
jgi:hypothetical protein